MGSAEPDVVYMSEPAPRVFLSDGLLERTRELLAGPGADGYEAVVVWVGRREPEQPIEALVAVRPGQIAYRGTDGCAVEVPPDALTALIATLPPDLSIVARVHTHPTEAYHSAVDDTNMLISHEGALSIVVPNFARAARLELRHCSVNELDHDLGWVELTSREVAERFVSP